MSRAAQLRSSLETSLEQRIPAAFSPQTRTELPVLSSGIPELDLLLRGGLPVGAITEIVGTASSGRLTCATAFVREVMQAEQVCAWIDVTDSFDPESAAGSGIDLDRLLWVRCGNTETPLSTYAPKQAAASTSASRAGMSPPLRSGGSPHPRHEVHGLPEALNSLLSRPLAPRRRQVGTPGVSNRRLEASERVEQVAFDRLPARRGTNLPRAPRNTALSPLSFSLPNSTSQTELPETSPFQKRQKPWSRLDQALRAADLLMQAGGFGALIFDLGHVDPQFANRIPLATWFRFRAAAERTRTVFLLLTQHPCAQSSAEVVLRTSLALPEAGTVMTAVPYTIERIRQRFTPPPSNVLSMRKPPQRSTAACWKAETLWSGGQ